MNRCDMTSTPITASQAGLSLSSSTMIPLFLWFGLVLFAFIGTIISVSLFLKWQQSQSTSFSNAIGHEHSAQTTSPSTSYAQHKLSPLQQPLVSSPPQHVTTPRAHVPAALSPMPSQGVYPSFAFNSGFQTPYTPTPSTMTPISPAVGSGGPTSSQF